MLPGIVIIAKPLGGVGGDVIVEGREETDDREVAAREGQGAELFEDGGCVGLREWREFGEVGFAVPECRGIGGEVVRWRWGISLRADARGCV